MTSLLHLDSSASPFPSSVSRQLTELFADLWRDRNGTAGYRYRDLAADPVPLVGPSYCTLGQRLARDGIVPPHQVAALADSETERQEWRVTLPLITEVLAADTVVIGAPMYNYSVPAALKAWIDRITFPGAFIDPDTGGQSLRDTTVVVITARGGGYGPGTPREGMDFQDPYLRAYFGDLGVAAANLHLVHAELTRAAHVPELNQFQPLAERSLAAARAAITALATQSATTHTAAAR